MYKTLILFLGILLTKVAFANPEFKLHSSVILENKPLAKLYTCDGKNINPVLDWSNAPPQTKSLVLIVSDRDAPKGTFYHWVLYNIPTNIYSIPEGISDHTHRTFENIKEAKNSFGEKKYYGPCPPRGERHNYRFTLYAIDKVLKLPKDATAENVLRAIQHHIIEQLTLTSTYQR